MSATVIYKAPESDKVQLAGDFSNWEPIDLLWRPESHDFYVDIVGLVPGAKYQYKFIINDNWCLDDESPREDDGNGNVNHVLNAKPVENVEDKSNQLPTSTSSAPAPVPLPIVEPPSSTSQSKTIETSSPSDTKIEKEFIEPEKETVTPEIQGEKETIDQPIASGLLDTYPVTVKKSVDSVKSESAIIGSQPATVTRLAQSVEPLNPPSDNADEEISRTIPRHNVESGSEKPTEIESTLITSKTSKLDDTELNTSDPTRPTKTTIEPTKTDIEPAKAEPEFKPESITPKTAVPELNKSDATKPYLTESDSARLKPTDAVKPETAEKETVTESNNLTTSPPTASSITTGTTLVSDTPGTADTLNSSVAAPNSPAASSRTKPKTVSTLRETNSTRDAQGQKKKSFFRRLFG